MLLIFALHSKIPHFFRVLHNDNMSHTFYWGNAQGSRNISNEIKFYTFPLESDKKEQSDSG